MAKQKANRVPAPDPVIWQNRITRYGEAAPGELLANEKNWRTHPQAQQDALDRKVRHGNHPVLNWNASCLSLQGDHKDNVQPTKPERGKSSKRIDGISATVTALARAMANPPKVHWC